MRKRARKDANHSQIAQAMRDVGYLVADTASLGDGFGDQVWAGIDRKSGQKSVWVIEIKTTKGNLTDAEKIFHQAWQGYVHIVRSVDDAYKLVGVLPR